MDGWLQAIGKAPAVLVTVAAVEGSGPREPGAKMLVTEGKVADTIGGGHLEQRAIEIARGMIGARQERRFERFALGPGLGQCCGGVVHLAFERVDAAQATKLRERVREDSWRLVALDGEPDAALFDGEGRMLCGTGAPAFDRSRGTHVMQDERGRRWLADAVFAPRAHLVLFGAGHVGAAIVRALADLPCTVTWVDEREDMFPASVPANVTVEATDIPEALVAEAPAGASYLVMTHSHALDQRLTEAIMARGDVGWFGLIGSHTKRMQFEHRLRARGVDEARIEAMVCPIGLPGIANKAPSVIAASVAAQLLGVWEAKSRQ
ncbi:xanthine dehydrogenase accessory protein XdhC [Massilia cavernae]|uniref:Xanthine dehydrogenase accessory protein XdhC n=1 Tax=Massilia cavernae TaxID=2320864 RepID=A0A418XGS2_9BURK|nr:xanthine dehydrogenase accessory protein XdhC [Massilia cavernae]RJG11656.1 xanthine dehydrogenase accessory protein XdhC [Massilia cavernae]